MQTIASNLKKKDFILYRDDMYQISAAEFYHPGKGRTVMRTKLKSLTTGRTVEVSFTSNETLEQLEVNATPAQFLYKNQNLLHFMHEMTYEEIEVSRDVIGDVADFLKEGQQVFLLMLDERPVGIRAPKSVTLEVIEAEDAVKGDTATNAKKLVVLETGVKVLVPLFIKKGNKIAINPETSEYQGREN